MNLFSFSESEGVYALMYTFASARLRILWDYGLVMLFSLGLNTFIKVGLYFPKDMFSFYGLGLAHVLLSFSLRYIGFNSLCSKAPR